MRVKLKNAMTIGVILLLVGLVIFLTAHYFINSTRVETELKNSAAERGNIQSLDASEPVVTKSDVPPPPPTGTPQLPKEEKPIVINAAFGLTKENNGDIMVGLYSTQKSASGYRRYFTYRCKTDGTLAKFDSGAYFTFGRASGVPVKDILFGGNLYPANGDYKTILAEMNKASEFTFSVPSSTTYLVKIHNRSTNDLPCL
jgi:hypothetical protein